MQGLRQEEWEMAGGWQDSELEDSERWAERVARWDCGER